MIATHNIPLNVPYKEKDQAKSHGARWNPSAKYWYIPEGVDDAPFTQWLEGAPKAEQPVSNTSHPPASDNKVKSAVDSDLDDVNAMLREAYEDEE